MWCRPGVWGDCQRAQGAGKDWREKCVYTAVGRDFVDHSQTARQRGRSNICIVGSSRVAASGSVTSHKVPGKANLSFSMHNVSSAIDFVYRYSQGLQLRIFLGV